MENREFQTNHIERIVEEVSDKRCVLAQLPTGGGKTVEFTLIAQRYNQNTDKSILILVHREELMYQAARTIEVITGIKPYIINSKTRKYYICRIYIGMVDSLVSRLNMFANVGLVIIDECHIANFNKIHNIFLEELIIGFSATPVSSNKKHPLYKFYKSIITGPHISELIKLGYLCQNITRCPKDIVDTSKFEIDKMKGDYKERSMSLEYSKPKNITNVIRNYHKYCLNKKTIVFNVTIDHSKEVNECFVSCGYNSRHLDSENGSLASSDPRFKNYREETLHWFKTTENAILNNIMIATVGFDEPTILCVITNFSTLSLPKWLQTTGRGGRIIKKDFIDKYQEEYGYNLKEKTTFDIIDMGGNAIKFGDWSDDRDWDYIFNNPDKPGNGIAPVKTCPECQGLLHASSMTCNLTNEKMELCLYEFERRVVKEKEDQEMVIITKGIDIEKIIEKNSNKYEYYTFFQLADPIIGEMFSQYENPSEKIINEGFKLYYELCKEWWSVSMAGKNGNIQDISNSAWHIKRALNNYNKKVHIRGLQIY